MTSCVHDRRAGSSTVRLRAVGAVVGTVAPAAAAPGVAWVLCREPLAVLWSRIVSGVAITSLPLELLLACVASVVVGGLSLWLLAVTICTVVEVATGASSALARSLTPTLLRRVVLTVCGVALGTGSVTAAAAAPAEQPRPAAAVAADLTGLRIPDRAEGEVAIPSPTHRVVVRGECLWSIASDLLPSGATAGRVAAAWRSIHRANRDAIGADPDLVRPGTVLHLPHELRRRADRAADPPVAGRPSAPTVQKGDDS